MKNKTKKISPAQLFFIIIQTQIGVGIFSLPNTMAKASKIDGWISLFLGGIVVQIFIMLYYFIMKKFPNKKIKEIVELIFGKKMKIIFEIGLLLYSIIVSVLILNLYTRMLDRWVLPETPNWILSLIMVVCCYFLAKEEIRVIARFYVIVSLFLFIFIALIIYSLKDANIYYILPIGSSGWKDILFGTKDVIIALLGFEIIMFLTAITSGTLELKIKFITASNIVVTLFYLLTTIACFLFFSPADILLIPEPLLYLIKAFSFKIIERTDLLFLSLWIVLVFTSFVSYVFWGAECIKGIFNSEKTSKNTFIILAIIFFAALLPLDTEQSMNQFSKYASYAGYMIISIPLVLLPFVLFSRKGQQHAKDN
ncbi:GerAB/ArcD/ProY family transporter [Bacillus sp. JJ1503]|uniref:GerAB/ArcD/ProY family transporter n=1 Tax=unclassified Bacillus (in: firmicutes) TaxID=185979 RepID=UPI002FFE1D21